MSGVHESFKKNFFSVKNQTKFPKILLLINLSLIECDTQNLCFLFSVKCATVKRQIFINNSLNKQEMWALCCAPA